MKRVFSERHVQFWNVWYVQLPQQTNESHSSHGYDSGKNCSLQEVFLQTRFSFRNLLKLKRVLTCQVSALKCFVD